MEKIKIRLWTRMLAEPAQYSFAVWRFAGIPRDAETINLLKRFTGPEPLPSR